jgi:aspartyl-tRNA(Asn)/glutamyl-tRNA(Gln) amidotransferase subunit C
LPIDSADVDHIADLARLELDEATLEDFRHQLQAILDHVSLLDALDVAQVPPTTLARLESRSPREDRPSPSLARDDALANAPDAIDGFFRVPPVLGE